MKVSVAMCTYNGAKYIREQLDSIFRQTIQDFELIICDDCSKDDTLQILRGYEMADKRVRVYQNETNLGFVKNFEKAFGLCQGDYIAPCDQDDIWTNDHLEKLLNILGDKTLACGNSELVDMDGLPIGMTLSEQEHLFRIPKNPLDLALSIFLCRNPFQGANMLFRRSFLITALPFPKEIEYHDVWFSCLSCFEDGLVYTFETINHYRIHKNNVSGGHIKKTTKPLLKRAIKSQFWDKREEILYSIKKRNVLDTSRKLQRWNRIVRILNNSNNKEGKVKNMPFILWHIRDIITK